MKKFSQISFDSIGGASGDMILATMLGLGVDLALLKKQLASLKIGRFDIVVSKCSEYGLNGQRVTVKIPHEHHPHRHLSDIRRLIRRSSLDERTKRLSMRVFERLAAAEGKVHGVSPEEVHFHEVGAMDSIIDIVGSCAALCMLGVTGVRAGSLPLGHGTIKTAHGVLPCPAPATVELLKGYPVMDVDEPFETVTPTGAALLVTWQEELGASHQSSIITAVAQGFGHRKLAGRPNMLRAVLSETAGGADSEEHDQCLILESNLDDTVPELIGSLSQKLMEKGALDVFSIPVQMKKQRPGTLLTVLCRPASRETMIDLIFSESTTFGVREHIADRTILARRIEEVTTRYGKVRVKIGTRKGKDITRSPEHDDCAGLAARHGVPVRRVYEQAVAAGR
ncbi:MAG: TIGR00299 family protein [Verrucomicrobia bacterium]|nr:TIGR00299 family protein [Verrucomicrobiota bacterium]